MGDWHPCVSRVPVPFDITRHWLRREHFRMSRVARQSRGPVSRLLGAARALVRRLRPEEGLLVIGFLASACLTIYANVDLYQQGIRSRALRGGLLRLAIVLGLAATLPMLERALRRGHRARLVGTAAF